MSYRIHTAHNLQTADDILKTAKIVKMVAGTYEIVVRNKSGRELVASLGDYGDEFGCTYQDCLVLRDASGVVARLSISSSAYNLMRELDDQVCKAYAA